MPFYPSCPDCGAELQDFNGVLRCPWFNAPGLSLARVVKGTILNCAKPKRKTTFALGPAQGRIR